MSILLRWQRAEHARTTRLALVGTYRAPRPDDRVYDEYYVIEARKVTSSQTRWYLWLRRHYFDGSFQTMENFPGMNPFTQYRRARLHAQIHLNAREERG